MEKTESEHLLGQQRPGTCRQKQKASAGAIHDYTATRIRTFGNTDPRTLSTMGYASLAQADEAMKISSTLADKRSNDAKLS